METRVRGAILDPDSDEELLDQRQGVPLVSIPSWTSARECHWCLSPQHWCLPPQHWCLPPQRGVWADGVAVQRAMQRAAPEQRTGLEGTQPEDADDQDGQLTDSRPHMAPYGPIWPHMAPYGPQASLPGSQAC